MKPNSELSEKERIRVIMINVLYVFKEKKHTHKLTKTMKMDL